MAHQKLIQSANGILQQIYPLQKFLSLVVAGKVVSQSEIEKARSVLSGDLVLRFYPQDIESVFFCKCGEPFRDNLECKNCDTAIQTQ